MKSKSILALSAAILLAASVMAPESFATCNSSMFNPATDVAWNGIFPIRVGGVEVAGNSSLPDGDRGTVNPLCTCTTESESYLGTEVGFWDIPYLEEVVDDAGCSTTLGMQFSSLDNGYHQGTNSRSVDAPHTFKQTHWVMFPAFQMLSMLTDVKCVQTGDLAFADLSEISPDYTDDYLATLKDPKAELVANKESDIACAAKSAIAQVPGGFFPSTYDALFWCLFDGNIYPLSGNVGSAHTLSATAQIAARQVYSYSEFGGILDYTMDSCQGQPNFIMKASQFRFQLAKPVKTATPFWAGQSELVWGSGKAPAYNDKNFLFVLFQKKKCCQKLKGAN